MISERYHAGSFVGGAVGVGGTAAVGVGGGAAVVAQKTISPSTCKSSMTNRHHFINDPCVIGW